MEKLKFTILVLCAGGFTFGADWTFLGVAKDLRECESMAQQQRLQQFKLSGKVLEDYYCCYGYTVSAALKVNPLVALAGRTLRAIDSLRPLVDPKVDYVEYLLPIKVAAEKALAIAKSDGESSLRTSKAMRNLICEISHSELLIDILLRREDKAAAYGRELVSIKEEIENLLN